MYMKALYLGTSGDGLQTGVGAGFKTKKEALGAFRELKKQEVDLKEAPFLVDLVGDDGDIVDTVGISEETYSLVTGQPVFSKEVYEQIDRDFWGACEAEYNKQKLRAA